MKETSCSMENEVVSQESTAYSELKNAIIQGVFPSGYQLVERTLAEQLNLSRTPIRSAIKRLEAEGYVSRGSNRRVYVSLLDNESILQLLYVREALEGMVARQAAKNRTEEQAHMLRKEIAEMQLHYQTEDGLAAYYSGSRIHSLWADCCGNKPLADLSNRIRVQTSRQNFQYLLLLGQFDNTLSEHVSITNYIIAKDEDAAEQAARFHIRQIREKFENSASHEKAHSALSVPWRME